MPQTMPETDIPPFYEFMRRLSPEDRERYSDIFNNLTNTALKEPSKAAAIADNLLPEFMDKSALYASIAIGYARQADDARKMQGPQSAEFDLNTRLSEIFQRKSTYLRNDETIEKRVTQ